MRIERAEIVLRARGRFDLRATVLSHRYHELAPFRWRDGARPVLERPEQLADDSVHLLRIRPAPRGAVLEVTGRDAREIEVLAPLAARVRSALALDVDLAKFHRACARDPLLRPVVRLGLGRMLRGTTVFEDVVKVLATSNTTWAHAVRSVNRLVAFGRRCPALPDLRAFPSPAALASISVRRLRDDTGLGYRAAWIRGLARDVVAGRRDLEAIVRLPGPEAARMIGAVPGIGRVGTAWLLLLLGHHDQPILDGVTRSFTRRALGDDDTALDQRLRRWRPWRGLALSLAYRASDRAARSQLSSYRSREGRARRAGRR